MSQMKQKSLNEFHLEPTILHQSNYEKGQRRPLSTLEGSLGCKRLNHEDSPFALDHPHQLWGARALQATELLHCQAKHCLSTNSIVNKTETLYQSLFLVTQNVHLINVNKREEPSPEKEGIPELERP